jgi:hypothetical protein
MKTMKAVELVLDFDLYPRGNIDAHNVKNLCNALEAGAELPPIVIDKKSKRVIDGFHRRKAHLQTFGDDAEVAVVEKSYKDDAAMFLDAVRYNGAHGAKLDPFDRARCTIIAERLSIPLDAVAGALNMPVDKLAALHTTRTAKDSGGLTIPIKRTFRHMAGRKLNKRQESANERSSGMNQVFYANQLIDLIEAKLLDKDDEKLLERLLVLHGLLEELLVQA